MSSGLHAFTKTIDFEDFKGERKTYDKWQAYYESKLGNLLMMHKLIRVMHDKGMGDKVLCVGCHPGVTQTNLQRDLGPIARRLFAGLSTLLLNSVAVAADSEVICVADPNAKAGDYAGPRYAELWGKSRWGNVQSAAAKNEKLQDALWAKCEELTGVTIL